jgi:uncharacterized membrane protein YoaT (DUF817 family)
MEDRAARAWPLVARFSGAEARLGRWAQAQGPLAAGLYEFCRFGVKQGWACLFGGALLALLLATHAWYPRHAALARYDFLTLAAVALQAWLLGLRMETWDEARVILLFHVTGTGMELFKTDVGSWIYPEASVLRIGGVPLFSGFMYASVGSYIARAWRLFEFRFSHHPGLGATGVLAAAIYVNFFTHHFIVDMRWALFAVAGFLFRRTWIYFRVWQVWRRMPLLLGFFLVAVFIWFGENIGTFAGAWLYPHQIGGWSAVPVSKLGAWFLLMLISYVMVSVVNRPVAFVAPAAANRSSRIALG